MHSNIKTKEKTIKLHTHYELRMKNYAVANYGVVTLHPRSLTRLDHGLPTRSQKLCITANVPKGSDIQAGKQRLSCKRTDTFMGAV